MEDKDLLEVCLAVTGAFEGGAPRYDKLAGNADGAGMSCGILQWNVGQGTLQKLLIAIADEMGWPLVNSFFPGSSIETLASLPPLEAIAYVKEHFLDHGNDCHFQVAALLAWRQFLTSPESIAAQRNYAENTILAAARHLAAKFMPEAADRTRVIAFFFDLVTQQGSMRTVAPVVGDDFSSGPALFYAASQDAACTALWRGVVGDDDVARKLIHYAFERALLGNPKYMWDTLSRRGTIAARVGIVHQTPINLTDILD